MRRKSNEMYLLALVVASVLIDATSAQTFFAQPQSHLGRLVQSIASPLILPSAAAYDEDSPSSSPAESGPYFEHGDSLAPSSSGFSSHLHLSQQPAQANENQHYQHYQAQQAPLRQHQPARYQNQNLNQRHQQQQSNLQQAPSQQRGIPQHYSGGADENDDANYSHRPSVQTTARHYRPRDTANQDQQQHQQQPTSAMNDFQLGAYLGPTIDDKEIQGAFNSNNDERDEDDGPAGYTGPPVGASETARGEHANGTPMQQYGPASSSAAGGGGGGGGGGYADPSRDPQDSYGPNEDAGDSSSADEDGDDYAGQHVRGARGQRPATSLSQAASQYHKQRQPHARTNQQLAAAANGYAPYGPVDLSGLMAAANGAQQGGFEIFNGDGSGFGGPMGGFGGPMNNQPRGYNGRRQQAASMGNQFGYQNGPMGYAPNQQQQQQRDPNANNEDDSDADADED